MPSDAHDGIMRHWNRGFACAQASGVSSQGTEAEPSKRSQAASAVEFVHPILDVRADYMG